MGERPSTGEATEETPSMSSLVAQPVQDPALSLLCLLGFIPGLGTSTCSSCSKREKERERRKRKERKKKKRKKPPELMYHQVPSLLFFSLGQVSTTFYVLVFLNYLYLHPPNSPPWDCNLSPRHLFLGYHEAPQTQFIQEQTLLPCSITFLLHVPAS